MNHECSIIFILLKRLVMEIRQMNKLRENQLIQSMQEITLI